MKYSETNLLTLITVVFIGFIILSFYIRYKFVSLHKNNLEITSSNGMNGCQLTKYLLEKLDLNIVIDLNDDELNGNYDPKNRKITLSKDISHSYSLSALSVTAHEIGHLLQDEDNYKLFTFLVKIYPLADFGASMSWILIIAGLIFPQLILMFATGLFLLMIALVYQLLQFPLEIDASNRAIKLLIKYKLISKNELNQVSEMLDYAALSFLAEPANLFFHFFDKVRR